MVHLTLDGLFGCVAAMARWQDTLKRDVVLSESSFELIGVFIVEDVELGVKWLDWKRVFRPVQAFVSLLDWQVYRGLERTVLLL
jgi:hypothetical protein